METSGIFSIDEQNKTIKEDEMIGRIERDDIRRIRDASNHNKWVDAGVNPQEIFEELANGGRFLKDGVEYTVRKSVTAGENLRAFSTSTSSYYTVEGGGTLTQIYEDVWAIMAHYHPFEVIKGGENV
jgi:hypothetical protein